MLNRIEMLERIAKQQYEFNNEVLLHNNRADELQKIKFSQIKKEIESIKKVLLINSISIGIVAIVLIICVVVNV